MPKIIKIIPLQKANLSFSPLSLSLSFIWTKNINYYTAGFYRQIHHSWVLHTIDESCRSWRTLTGAKWVCQNRRHTNAGQPQACWAVSGPLPAGSSPPLTVLTARNNKAATRSRSLPIRFTVKGLKLPHTSAFVYFLLFFSIRSVFTLEVF